MLNDTIFYVIEYPMDVIKEELILFLSNKYLHILKDVSRKIYSIGIFDSNRQKCLKKKQF